MLEKKDRKWVWIIVVLGMIDSLFLVFFGATKTFQIVGIVSFGGFLFSTTWFDEKFKDFDKEEKLNIEKPKKPKKKKTKKKSRGKKK